MKKMMLFAVAAMGCIVMTGCATTNNNDMAIDFNAVVCPAEFETVMEVGAAKVSGEAQVNVVFNLISWGTSCYADRSFTSTKSTGGLPISLIPDAVQQVKQAAVFDALAGSNADALLNAKYEIDTMDYIVFKTINCKVTGYPGTEKGLKACK